MSNTLAMSCYIRTLNEADRLGDVLRAVSQLTDDIVVVDSGSTDDTVAIAQGFGARVIQQSWLGNGRQKRVGEDACQNDWLLDLDADEVMTDGLVSEVKALFASGRPSADVYNIPLVFVPPHGKPWYGFARAKRAKLYNRTILRMPDHEAWDQLDIPANAKLGMLSAPILHYSFRSIEHMVYKMNRVSSARLKGKQIKSHHIIFVRVLFGFPVYFSKNYLYRGMIRGGVYGFSIACILAMGRWLRDVKMLEQHLRLHPPAQN